MLPRISQFIAHRSNCHLNNVMLTHRGISRVGWIVRNNYFEQMRRRLSSIHPYT